MGWGTPSSVYPLYSTHPPHPIAPLTECRQSPLPPPLRPTHQWWCGTSAMPSTQQLFEPSQLQMCIRAHTPLKQASTQSTLPCMNAKRTTMGGSVRVSLLRCAAACVAPACMQLMQAQDSRSQHTCQHSQLVLLWAGSCLKHRHGCFRAVTTAAAHMHSAPRLVRQRKQSSSTLHCRPQGVQSLSKKGHTMILGASNRQKPCLLTPCQEKHPCQYLACTSQLCHNCPE